jgi:hypothetical protein
MNIIKKREKNTKALNSEILKTLLISPTKSMYRLHQDFLKQKGFPYPTVRRRCKNLKDKGLIDTDESKRKNGKTDRRGTTVLTLTSKGLAHLILESDLKNDELEIIGSKLLDRYFEEVSLRKVSDIGNIPITTLKEVFKQMKSRINLQHFNEKYFSKLFEDLFFDLGLKMVRQQKKILLKAHSNKRIKTQASKDLKVANTSENVNYFNEILKRKNTEYKDLENDIRLLKIVIRTLKSQRKQRGFVR